MFGLRMWKLRIFRLVVGAIVGIIVLVTLFFYRFPLDYKDLIKTYSKEYSLDPYLVAAIIKVESGFNKDAISNKDARGLMQIGKQTGQWASEVLRIPDYNEDSLFEPRTNIRIGTWYLNNLYKEFGGNLDLVLAAYNAGSGNVTKWLQSEECSLDGETLCYIPFGETRDYLDKVKASYDIYKKVYRKSFIID